MTRQVSLSEEAYSTLSKMKGKDMSFSDIVMKLTDSAKQKRDFLKFAGALKSQSEELEQLKKQIELERQANTEQ